MAEMPMTKEQFDRETNYRAAISMIRGLLIKGLITRREYVRIDTILARKLSPVWGVLYREST